MGKRGRPRGRTGFQRAFVERNAAIVRDYYGDAETDPMSLAEVGKKYNLTRERVRQLLKAAGRDERHNMCASRIVARDIKMLRDMEVYNRRMAKDMNKQECIRLYELPERPTIEEIAKRLSRSIGWVVNTLREAENLKRRSVRAGQRRNILTPGDRQAIADRIAAGEDRKSVAAEYGVTVQYAQNLFYQLKKKPTASELRAQAAKLTGEYE